MFEKLFLISLFILSIGCASPKSALPPNSLPQGAPLAKLNIIPFVPQKQNTCGPSALMMAIMSLGETVDFQTLKKMSYTPQLQGSRSSDLVAAARRLGFAAYQFSSLSDLIDLSSDGHAVIVYHFSGNILRDLWHFSVLTGYDLQSQQMSMHSGNTSNLKVDLDDFVSNFERGGRWAMVVTRPEQIIPDKKQSMDNVLAFIRLKNWDAAERLNQAALRQWPSGYQFHLLQSEIFLGKYRKKNLAIQQLRLSYQLSVGEPNKIRQALLKQIEELSKL